MACSHKHSVYVWKHSSVSTKGPIHTERSQKRMRYCLLSQYHSRNCSWLFIGSFICKLTDGLEVYRYHAGHAYLYLFYWADVQNCWKCWSSPSVTGPSSPRKTRTSLPNLHFWPLWQESRKFQNLKWYTRTALHAGNYSTGFFQSNINTASLNDLLVGLRDYKALSGYIENNH